MQSSNKALPCGIGLRFEAEPERTQVLGCQLAMQAVAVNGFGAMHPSRIAG